MKFDLKKASGFLSDLLSLFLILDEVYDKWKAARWPAETPPEKS